MHLNCMDKKKGIFEVQTSLSASSSAFFNLCCSSIAWRRIRSSSFLRALSSSFIFSEYVSAFLMMDETKKVNTVHPVHPDLGFVKAAIGDDQPHIRLDIWLDIQLGI